MSEARATGFTEEDQAKALALDLVRKGFNVRIIGPVDQVQVSAAAGSKWLVLGTREATFSLNFN